ncbi:hypothetical protein [Bradyrhizobium sp.]|uniref:hypothetical protein n=1 Tax=Bradyrhizobium sp. TaxID=376 RepID=UPI003C577468
MKLLRIAGDGFRRLLAAASARASAFREWFERPKASQSRGRKLLREWLSPEQLAQYDAHNYFEVTGCHTARRYRIHHGTGMNVFQLEHVGRPLIGWCFVPQDDLVAGDVMLAQKIALETDEQGALAVAKCFSIR